MTNTGTPPLPDFLIIGAQKSGTRWLRSHLGEHPEVFTAGKELRFFNDPVRFSEGLESYRAEFEGWAGEPLVGEATPSYMMWREDPARMAERIEYSLPGAKLFAVLRNPVDRVYSAFVHYLRAGKLPSDANLMETIRSVPPEDDSLALISGGWYAASLEPYFERFGDRLRVFLNDDVAGQPGQVYTRALDHLRASTGLHEPDLSERRFAGRTPESSAYAEEGGGRRELMVEERLELFEHFREDVLRLEELLGRDLSLWRPR